MQSDLGFALFGTPIGLKAKKFGFYENFRINYFDIDNTEIKVLPNSSLYRVNRFIQKGDFYITFFIYEFAKARNSEREGCFNGASIGFKNCFASSEIILSHLHELLAYANFGLQNNSRFKVEDFESIYIRRTFAQDLQKSLKKNPSKPITSGETVFFKLNESFSSKLNLIDSIFTEELNNYSDIYFSSSVKTEEYIRDKNKIPIKFINLDFKSLSEARRNFLNELHVQKNSLLSQIEQNQKTSRHLSEKITHSIKEIERLNGLVNDLKVNANNFDSIIKEGKKYEEEINILEQKCSTLKKSVEDKKEKEEELDLSLKSFQKKIKIMEGEFDTLVLLKDKMDLTLKNMETIISKKKSAFGL
ncbi:MAG: hypothetical protein ED557_00155 [Balneola sp.]|nr:MAG: hypothetical protein ED557_00155 [Balneola sp.]